jgi:hypothetical protein
MAVGIPGTAEDQPIMLVAIFCVYLNNETSESKRTDISAQGRWPGVDH